MIYFYFRATQGFCKTAKNEWKHARARRFRWTGNGQAFAGVTQELGEAVRWVDSTEGPEYIEVNGTEYDFIY